MRLGSEVTPTARTLGLLLAAALSACDPFPRDREADVQHCHQNGYFAEVELGVRCCSNLNGESICLSAHEITKHRRETWPQ